MPTVDPGFRLKCGSRTAASIRWPSQATAIQASSRLGPWAEARLGVGVTLEVSRPGAGFGTDSASVTPAFDEWPVAR